MITTIITPYTGTVSTRLVGVVGSTCDDGYSFFSFILLCTAPIGGTMIKSTLQLQVDNSLVGCGHYNCSSCCA